MEYTVIGDVDIYLLASWFYGDIGLFDIIYYANQSIIGDDPEGITAGMVLDIPEIEVEQTEYRIPATQAD